MSDDSGPSPTPGYSRVVDASAGVAREMGHSYVGVEHLFLAMIRDRSAVPTQVLARSMDLDQVEASLLEVLASPEYNGAPPADAVWFGLSELSELVGVLPRCVPPGVDYGFNVAGDRAWIGGRSRGWEKDFPASVLEYGDGDACGAGAAWDQ